VAPVAAMSFFATGRISPRCSSGMSDSFAPWYLGMTRAWPRLRGLMSRKASVLSLSKSLKQGISPLMILQKMHDARLEVMRPVM